MNDRATVTRETYERAERFLPWNVEPLVYAADVSPRWIAGSDRIVVNEYVVPDGSSR